MKKYLKAVVSGLCAAALALGCVGCGSSARKVMAYEALMRSDMEALRSPATIMKLAQEQGALYEIERLTFFKSLETFAQKAGDKVYLYQIKKHLLCCCLPGSSIPQQTAIRQWQMQKAPHSAGLFMFVFSRCRMQSCTRQ